MSYKCSTCGKKHRAGEICKEQIPIVVRVDEEFVERVIMLFREQPISLGFNGRAKKVLEELRK